MPDRLTIEQRHNNMAAIRGRNTKPEILVEFHSQHIYLPVSLIYRSAITSIPSLSISLSRKGFEVLVLSDNINRAAQKGFKVCFQTDYQEKLRGHFYIDIYIAAIVVLVSCYRTKEAQGGDAEGVLQFFGMRCDEGYVFFSCFHS